MKRSILVAIPVLGLAVMIQTSIVGRINLLNGAADLVLLILAAWSLQERVRSAWVWGAAAGLLVGFVSVVPWYVYLVGYLAIVGMARLLAHRVWQAPLLAMFTVTFIGTMVLLMLTYVERSLFEVSLPFNLSFAQIILPSILLNLLLAIPMHAIIRDLANRLYPEEVVS
ncbi:MAG: rod shape-determining protein MreD [Chloroflexi bacterium]|nr:rod shape-determining protein MreD [Chloroflexota bacterium]